ncbi:MAG TPA: hypothetical protein VGK48_13505 [Terriglobia bacterium]|jgi:hypothetical protein
MSSKKQLLFPLLFTAGLAGLGLLAPIRENPKALWAFLGTALVLAGWNIALGATLRAGRKLAIEVVIRKQHYVQACAQACVLLYWGWYWQPVSNFAPFILAQLLFAYAFDMLFCWSRRDSYVLGFAPFPIIFSINLFLWFKPDWFYLQFAMVALGIAAKELIRWNKEGRPAHIFNPSSFPLAVFSVVLLATGTSGITLGQEIATTQFYPPHMYLWLFLIGLPGQLLFGVTSMTMSAVITTYLFGLLYHASTGIYFFYDSYIPIGVFLGMLLLFTDPSTSPRTELGRIVFGSLYGLGTVLAYQLLGSAGMPTFYDKLLPVPILNLSIIAIDRAARSGILRRFDPAAIGRAPTPYARNLAYVSVWAAAFAVMSAAQGVGDSHPGQWLPFWRQACKEGRSFACPYLADLESSFCDRGSGWACNEAGLLYMSLAQSGEDLRRTDPAGAAEPFMRGCDLNSPPACRNLVELKSGENGFTTAPPKLDDYPIILRGSKGPVRERDAPALYALACREGWQAACRLSGQ